MRDSTDMHMLNSYSGTHEDDDKIAKTRDVTLNHRKYISQRKMAAENLLSLIVELHSSRRSKVATTCKCLREVLCLSYPATKFVY